MRLFVVLMSIAWLAAASPAAHAGEDCPAKTLGNAVAQVREFCNQANQATCCYSAVCDWTNSCAQFVVCAVTNPLAACQQTELAATCNSQCPLGDCQGTACCGDKTCCAEAVASAEEESKGIYVVSINFGGKQGMKVRLVTHLGEENVVRIPSPLQDDLQRSEPVTLEIKVESVQVSTDAANCYPAPPAAPASASAAADPLNVLAAAPPCRGHELLAPLSAEAIPCPPYPPAGFAFPCPPPTVYSSPIAGPDTPVFAHGYESAPCGSAACADQFALEAEHFMVNDANFELAAKCACGENCACGGQTSLFDSAAAEGQHLCGAACPYFQAGPERGPITSESLFSFAPCDGQSEQTDVVMFEPLPAPWERHPVEPAVHFPVPAPYGPLPMMVAPPVAPHSAEESQLERQERYEQHIQQRIEEHLSWITGVKVGVHAELEPYVHRMQRSVRFAQPTAVESVTESRERSLEVCGFDFQQSHSEDKQRCAVGSEVTMTVQGPGGPQRVKASVAIPRSYLYRVCMQRSSSFDPQALLEIEEETKRMVESCVVQLLPWVPPGVDPYPLVQVSCYEDNLEPLTKTAPKELAAFVPASKSTPVPPPAPAPPSRGGSSSSWGKWLAGMTRGTVLRSAVAVWSLGTLALLITLAALHASRSAQPHPNRLSSVVQHRVGPGPEVRSRAA